MMKSKVTTALFIGTCLALAACNTVRGAAADASSAANCTESTIKNGRCCLSDPHRVQKKSPAGLRRRGSLFVRRLVTIR